MFLLLARSSACSRVTSMTLRSLSSLDVRGTVMEYVNHRALGSSEVSVGWAVGAAISAVARGS